MLIQARATFRLARFPALFVLLASAWGINGCASARSDNSQSLSSTYKQAIASPIRTSEDRDADAKRKPLAFLEFAQVRPGMRVLDVSAGGGYSTQLLALTVGGGGTVWAQVPEMRAALKQRLERIPQGNIVPVIRPFEDPVPVDAPKFDLITLIWNYHDIAYLPVERAKMNRRLFDALKPGGHLVLIDHSAKPGAGTSVAKSLHRIDESVVMAELEQAGFRLEQETNAFRNPADARDQSVFSMTIPVDNFALRFVRP